MWSQLSTTASKKWSQSSTTASHFCQRTTRFSNLAVYLMKFVAKNMLSLQFELYILRSGGLPLGFWILWGFGFWDTFVVILGPYCGVSLEYRWVVVGYSPDTNLCWVLLLGNQAWLLTLLLKLVSN